MSWQPNPSEVENLKKLLAGATTGDTRVQNQIRSVRISLSSDGKLFFMFK